MKYIPDLNPKLIDSTLGIAENFKQFYSKYDGYLIYKFYKNIGPGTYKLVPENKTIWQKFCNFFKYPTGIHDWGWLVISECPNGEIKIEWRSHKDKHDFRDKYINAISKNNVSFKYLLDVCHHEALIRIRENGDIIYFNEITADGHVFDWYDVEKRDKSYKRRLDFVKETNRPVDKFKQEIMWYDRIHADRLEDAHKILTHMKWVVDKYKLRLGG